MREVLTTVAAFPVLYNLSKKETYEKVLSDIRNGKAGDIQYDLYAAYSDNLRKAVRGVMDDDTADRLCANVSRFAAYKAYHATQKLKERHDDNPDTFDRLGKAVLNTFNRYQAAEYNTTVARCRTARQYNAFMQNENRMLFPNIRWLPSSSANPREEHRVFWNRVWAKDDPFWQNNQPGNIWNCKCDWEETFDDADTDNPEGRKPAAGLEGNPAITGEVFTDRASYISKAGTNRRERDRVEFICESACRDATIANNPLRGKTTTCTIGEETHNVIFTEYGIKEYAQAMFGNKKCFWLKNEILKDMPEYIKNAEYLGYKEVDLKHNTNKRRLNFKKALDYYVYFETRLPNSEKICLQLCRLKSTGDYILYTTSKNAPADIIKEIVP